MARECHCPRSHGLQTPSPTKIPQKCWNGKTNYPPLQDHRSSANEVPVAVDVDSTKTLERKIELLMDCYDRHDARLQILEAEQALGKLEKDDEGLHQTGIERVDSSSCPSFPKFMCLGENFC